MCYLLCAGFHERYVNITLVEDVTSINLGGGGSESVSPPSLKQMYYDIHTETGK